MVHSYGRIASVCGVLGASFSCALNGGIVQVNGGGANDAAPADGGSLAVWTAASTGFELDEGGGLAVTAPGVPTDCVSSNPTWRYDAAAQSLVRTGCEQGTSISASVVVSNLAAARIAARILALRPATPSTIPSCGGDAVSFTLTVFDPRGTQSYQSCRGAGSGPVLDFEGLLTLSSDLDQDLAACSPDGGFGSNEAATCTQVGPVGRADAGLGDATDATDATVVVHTVHGGTTQFTVAQGETVVTLASGQILPYVIALDATNVYWADWGDGSNPGNGSVMKVPVGGGLPTTLASGQKWAGGIAVDSASVYWTAATGATGGLFKIAKDGGTSELLSSSFTNDSIVTGSSMIIGTGQGDSLLGVPAGGGTTQALGGQLGQNTYGIALDSTSAYWSCFSGDCPVLKTPLTGGTPTTLATGHVVFGIAVDATDVYWAEMGNGTIMKVPIAGGNATTVASGLAGPNQIAMDTNDLYVTVGTQAPPGSGSGSIAKVAKDGSGVTYLATGIMAPSGIAVDATSVYWTTLGGSTISEDGAATAIEGSIMKATPK